MNKIVDLASETQTSDTVRVGLLHHVILTIAANNGPSEAALLEAAGLSKDQLTDPDGRAPASYLEKLVCAGVRLSKDPLLALHASEHADLSGFGVLGYIQQACGTVREVIDVIKRYEHLLSDMGRTALLHEPGAALWCFDVRTENTDFARHATDFMLGCWRLGFKLRPAHPQTPSILAVYLRHSPPENSVLLAEYLRIFGCPVYFNKAVSALVLSVDTLKMPLAHPDAGLQEVLEQHARQLMERCDKSGTLLDRARAQLRVLLHSGCASREMLAETLGISSRHLHRQLQREGVTYNQLIDKLRLELAHSYLANSSDSIATVAERLKFTETQSFIRWFRQMTGETPRKYRQGLGDQS